jgi:hypothetical protein
MHVRVFSVMVRMPRSHSPSRSVVGRACFVHYSFFVESFGKIAARPFSSIGIKFLEKYAS